MIAMCSPAAFTGFRALPQMNIPPHCSPVQGHLANGAAWRLKSRHRHAMPALMAADERSWWDKLMTGEKGGRPPPPPPPAPPPPPTLADLFAQLDRDDDGVLSVEECKRGLILLGLREIEFKELDKDGNGVISLDEWETMLPEPARERILERLAREGGKLQSLYVPPEEWVDTESAKKLQWEQKVQMQARREGNGMRQNDILRDELGKG